MLRTHLTGPFARNIAAYGASEVAAKLSRIFVVMAVARSLGAEEIGIAAAAMAASDILKSLTENGIGQRLIAARDGDLAALCRTALRIFWLWALGLFVVQLGVGATLAWVSGDPMLLLLVAVLAGEFLFMPAGLVQAALAMRAGKLKRTAAIAGAQVVGANVLTVALVLLWPSPLALVVPKLLSAPIWLIAMRRLHPWVPDRSIEPSPLGPFVSFGAPVLGVELVKALRLHADKLLVGALLGPEALGLYFMAFNAGLGLANSFSFAFASVLFPHLVTADSRMRALRQAFGVGIGVIAPVVVVQSLAAPFYVPILFGPGWAHLSEIVSILCLAAIPGIVWTTAAGWLRAETRPGAELRATVIMALALLGSTVLMAPHGLVAIATGYLVTATLTQLALSLPALSAAFGPRSQEV
ncbi:MAG: oligosaccharide flippase family protein [Pseudomonadota bacterium]|nr:oligosaccharide flippase family protein [Pseudomonadota bacterium]